MKIDFQKFTAEEYAQFEYFYRAAQYQNAFDIAQNIRAVSEYCQQCPLKGQLIQAVSNYLGNKHTNKNQ